MKEDSRRVGSGIEVVGETSTRNWRYGVLVWLIVVVYLVFNDFDFNLNQQASQNEVDWINDSRTGTGKYTWPSGNIYDGDFVNGSRTGTGKYTWSSGAIYEGDFVNGLLTGTGKFTWPDGNIYEGDFVNDSRTGTGKFTWLNGDFHIGEWKEGKQM